MDPDIRGRALGCCMAGLFILMTAGCGQGRLAWDDASGPVVSCARRCMQASARDPDEYLEALDPR